MAQYVIESPHTTEERKGEDTLKKFALERKSGEHRGWAYIDAYLDASREKSIRDSARIIKR